MLAGGGAKRFERVGAQSSRHPYFGRAQGGHHDAQPPCMVRVEMRESQGMHPADLLCSQSRQHPALGGRPSSEQTTGGIDNDVTTIRKGHQG